MGIDAYLSLDSSSDNYFAEADIARYQYDRYTYLQLSNSGKQLPAKARKHCFASLWV
jgi:hypothetical protein